jgi:hypothetical protein
MTESDSRRLHDWLHDTTGRAFSRAQKLLLAGGIVVAVVVSELVQWILGAAPIRGHSASLFQRGAPVNTLVAAVTAIVAGVALATLLVGRVRADAGIFCVAVALLAFRLDGGAGREALLAGNGRAAFSLLAGELTILAVVLLATSAFLRRLASAGALPDDHSADGATLEPETLDQKFLCTATVAVVMTASMMLLCQSDWPGQAVWATLISGFAAAWCAFRFVPVAPSAWLWAGPLVAGIVGYLYTGLYGWQNAAIGQPEGMLAALARPMPLDYASVGVAGAMLGYWVGRRQLHERQVEAERLAAEGSAA